MCVLIAQVYQSNTRLSSVQFSSVTQSCPTFATPSIAARQASLYSTNTQSSLRFMSIESVMPSSHLILCRPLLLLPPMRSNLEFVKSHIIILQQSKDLSCNRFASQFAFFYAITLTVTNIFTLSWNCMI